MGEIRREGRPERPAGAYSESEFRRTISTREIMEELVVAELRARRLTRRGQSQLIRLVRDYRLSESDARNILEAACDRLAAEGVVVDRLPSSTDDSTCHYGKLIVAAIGMLLIQVLWRMW